MAWIAFASVPTVLVVMLAMGQLEAWLLPRTPPGEDERDLIGPAAGRRAGAGRPQGAGHRPAPMPAPAPTAVPAPAPAPAPARANGPGPGFRPQPEARTRWEIPAAAVRSRQEART
ncbi:MAG TPA: hypothetical protein VFU43_07415 [Streptosporangiaceae bacterium]|nr:hypothetical protein [Streptosporangiaceae bacterium]